MEKSLCEMIKEARMGFKKPDGRKLTQSELAEQLGVSTQTISLYETGGREVSIEQLKKIAKATGKPVSWFFGEEASNPDIKTVSDVINRLEQLEKAFHSIYSIQTCSHQHEDTYNYWLELSFSIPYSYKKVFDDLEALHNARRENNIPDKVFDLWYKSIIEEQSKIGVDDMLKEN